MNCVILLHRISPGKSVIARWRSLFVVCEQCPDIVEANAASEAKYEYKLFKDTKPPVIRSPSRSIPAEPVQTPVPSPSQPANHATTASPASPATRVDLLQNVALASQQNTQSPSTTTTSNLVSFGGSELSASLPLQYSAIQPTTHTHLLANHVPSLPSVSHLNTTYVQPPVPSYPTPAPVPQFAASQVQAFSAGTMPLMVPALHPLQPMDPYAAQPSQGNYGQLPQQFIMQGYGAPQGVIPNGQIITGAAQIPYLNMSGTVPPQPQGYNQGWNQDPGYSTAYQQQQQWGSL
jgi:hypothetical protein